MVYVGDCLYIDQNDNVDHEHRARVHSFEDLVRVRTVWRAPGHRGDLDQPAVLFPRELALNIGGITGTPLIFWRIGHCSLRRSNSVLANCCCQHRPCLAESVGASACDDRDLVVGGLFLGNDHPCPLDISLYGSGG